MPIAPTCARGQRMSSTCGGTLPNSWGFTCRRNVATSHGRMGSPGARTWRAGGCRIPVFAVSSRRCPRSLMRYVNATQYACLTPFFPSFHEDQSSMGKSVRVSSVCPGRMSWARNKPIARGKKPISKFNQKIDIDVLWPCFCTACWLNCTAENTTTFYICSSYRPGLTPWTRQHTECVIMPFQFIRLE